MSSESELIPYHAVQTLGKGPVLVLAPHPDDEVLGCAGAIMRHIAAADPVTVVILTDGGGFHADGLEREGYIAQRRRESRAAAAVLGYGEPWFWDYRDRELTYNESLLNRLCETAATLNVRWIYAPSPYELHPDHRHAAWAALEVTRCLNNGLTLIFYEISAPLPPNRLLDISDLLEHKRRAMACFTSQLAIQAYDRHVEALNRYRTYTLPREIEAAEAYWVVENIEAMFSDSQSIAGVDVHRWAKLILERNKMLQSRLDALQAEIIRLDQTWRDRYEQIVSSRSWRLTALLRNCARWLRRRHG